MLRSFVPVSAAMVFISCGLVTEVDERFVGAIGYPDRVSVEVPDTVQAGVEFSVAVKTYGPDGCWSRDSTAVAVEGLSATVTPYDVKVDGYCTQAPVEISHAAVLTFSQPGIAEIAFEGRDGTVERTVVVE